MKDDRDRRDEDRDGATAEDRKGTMDVDTVDPWN